jgi:hypothetical protein
MTFKCITIFIYLVLLQHAIGYVDVDLAIETSSADVSLNMPITINNHVFHIGVSL